MSGFSGPIQVFENNMFNLLPKLWTFANSKFIPLLESLLIRLFGGGKYQRKYGQIQLLSGNDGSLVGLTVDLIYSVPSIKDVSATKEDIQTDIGFIVENMAPIAQSVKVNSQSIRFDTTNGTFRITATIQSNEGIVQ